MMQAVQQLYEECQATFDPNAVAGLLHSHPYHLDALLTMHDLHRSMGEHAYAGEGGRVGGWYGCVVVGACTTCTAPLGGALAGAHRQDQD